MEKFCTKCNTLKSKAEFRVNKSKSDGLQHYCLICDKSLQREWYINNKEKVKIKSKITNDKIRAKNKAFLIDYLKQHPCVKCGESDIVVLEFDHLRDKYCNVSRLVTSSNILKIKEEIEKCQVLCANCHKRKTAIDFNWYKLNN